MCDWIWRAARARTIQSNQFNRPIAQSLREATRHRATSSKTCPLFASEILITAVWQKDGDEEDARHGSFTRRAKVPGGASFAAIPSSSSFCHPSPDLGRPLHSIPPSSGPSSKRNRDAASGWKPSCEPPMKVRSSSAHRLRGTRASHRRPPMPPS